MVQHRVQELRDLEVVDEHGRLASRGDHEPLLARTLELDSPDRSPVHARAGEVRAREVGVDEHRVRQIRSGQVGVRQLRPVQACLGERSSHPERVGCVGVRQVRRSEVRALEVGVPEVGLREQGAFEARVVEDREIGDRLGQARPLHRGAAERRADEARLLEARPVEPSLGQVGFAKTRPVEVRAPQVRVPEVDPVQRPDLAGAGPDVDGGKVRHEVRVARTEPIPLVDAARQQGQRAREPLGVDVVAMDGDAGDLCRHPLRGLRHAAIVRSVGVSDDGLREKQQAGRERLACVERVERVLDRMGAPAIEMPRVRERVAEELSQRRGGDDRAGPRARQRDAPELLDEKTHVVLRDRDGAPIIELEHDPWRGLGHGYLLSRGGGGKLAHPPHAVRQ